MKGSQLYKFGSLTFVLMLLMIFQPVQIVNGHGGASTSTYKGPMLLVPYTNSSPVIDGKINLKDFPEAGHFNITGFLDEVRISHNKTAMFVSVTTDGAEFAGVGVKNRALHKNTNPDSLFFVGGVNNGSVSTVKNGSYIQSVVLSHSDYDAPVVETSNRVSFVGAVNVVNDTRNYEFMIPLLPENYHRSSGVGSVTDILPELGALLDLVVIRGEGDNLLSTVVTKTQPIPVYLLRVGETAAQIEQIMANSPSWETILLWPSILFILSVYFVVKYEVVPIRRSN